MFACLFYLGLIIDISCFWALSHISFTNFRMSGEWNRTTSLLSFILCTSCLFVHTFNTGCWHFFNNMLRTLYRNDINRITDSHVPIFVYYRCGRLLQHAPTQTPSKYRRMLCTLVVRTRSKSLCWKDSKTKLLKMSLVFFNIFINMFLVLSRSATFKSILSCFQKDFRLSCNCKNLYAVQLTKFSLDIFRQTNCCLKILRAC